MHSESTRLHLSAALIGQMCSCVEHATNDNGNYQLEMITTPPTVSVHQTTGDTVNTKQTATLYVH